MGNKRYTLILFLVLFMFGATGCEPGKVLEVTSCALKDERLSVTFSSPERARAQLKHLGKGLEEGDPDAIEETGRLLSSLARCLQ